MDELVDKAKMFSQRYHAGQLYGNGGDYFVFHIQPVVEKAIELAEKLGLHISEVTILAYLHDILEDCDQVTFDMIEKDFGKDILDGIILLSNRIAFLSDSKKSMDEYFSAIGHAKAEVKIVKVADRIINITFLSEVLDEKRKKRLIKKYTEQGIYFKKYDIYPQFLTD